MTLLNPLPHVSAFGRLYPLPHVNNFGRPAPSQCNISASGRPYMIDLNASDSGRHFDYQCFASFVSRDKASHVFRLYNLIIDVPNF